MFKWSRRSIWNTYFIDFLSKFIGVLDKQNYREVHLKRLALGKFDCQLRLIKIISTHIGKIGTTSSWWFEICNFLIFHCPNSEISSLNWLFELSKTGHALGIRICGCSLFSKRELWASKSAGAHSTKSLKISGCKSWYSKDLWVPAPSAPALTHSLNKQFRLVLV